MLRLTGLTKAFGIRTVLDHLDLQIDAGESTALVGANGSGKTTTLRCIAGLARPDSGRIAIGGIDLALDPVGARRRLSYLPQRSTFPPTLTVRETLEVVARLRRSPSTAVARELDSCGLAGLADRNVNNLSGGERQRLAIAVAFLPTVDLYVFDEPSASLDPVASRILFDRARELRREGRTLLFTTHVPTDLRHLATRVVMLRDGRIQADGCGEFERRRYERLLERDSWGEIDEGSLDDDRLATGDLCNHRLRGAGAVAGARAARSC